MFEIRKDLDQLIPLTKRFDTLEPRIMLIVGTGISFGATGHECATWKGLLLNAIDTLIRDDNINSEILKSERNIIENAFAGNFDLDEILQRADSIVNRFGGLDSANFANWLANSIGKLKARVDQSQSLEAISELGKAGAIIVTTNYDNILCEATGLEPVTWEEPDAMLEILNRKREGIIHIHGHFTRPSSVVLGRSSYMRIKEAALTQVQLKSLWLYWHWVFLGCGSGGLDDPNMGALLRWAYETKLKNSAPQDFFLSTQETIDQLPEQLADTGNTTAISYSDHAIDLPLLLRKLLPKQRAAPFHLVGSSAHRVRRKSESPLNSPFPSWDEYISGLVPAIAADEQVSQRLDDKGWAFVIDSASIGKTTLAFRMAARAERKGYQSYYLLLNKHVTNEPENDISPQAALSRLARPGILFILDDCHQQPELVSTLWEQWRERPNGSMMLLLTTRIEKSINLLGNSNLLELEMHPFNSAISLQLTIQDMGSIAEYVMSRADPTDKKRIEVPQKIQREWHDAFSREIGAFVVAISQRRSYLLQGDFELPYSACAEWISERYLDTLEDQDIKNAEYLAVFGTQEYEADVPKECLPHPSRIGRLLKSGLAVSNQSVNSSKNRYGLREPDWGVLILSAIEAPTNRIEVFIGAASRSIYFATVISSFLKRQNDLVEYNAYWQKLSDYFLDNPVLLTEQILMSPIECAAHFVDAAKKLNHSSLVNSFWTGVALKPKLISERIFHVSLEHFGRFLNVAMQHGQYDLIEIVWTNLAKDPKRLAHYSLKVSPQNAARFINVAKKHGQAGLLNDVWVEITKESNQLSERVFQTPIGHFGRFLRVANEHGQTELVKNVWARLASEPERLFGRLLQSNPNDLSGLLKVADEQGREDLVRRFWIELAMNRNWLTKGILEMPLDHINLFMKIAKRNSQERLVDLIYAEFQRDSIQLANHVIESTFESTIEFFYIALDSGQRELVNRLWAILDKKTDWLENYASKYNLRVWGELKRPILKYRVVN